MNRGLVVPADVYIELMYFIYLNCNSKAYFLHVRQQKYLYDT